MTRDRARRQRVEQVVIGPVVAEPEHEVRRLLSVREEAADVDALVDAERAHLDDLVPDEDLGRRPGEVLVEVVEQLARAPRPVLGLGLAVVPRDAARLPLDVRAGNVGRDAPQESLDRPQPGEIEVDERPPLPARRTREVAVLGAQVDRDPPEPLLEIAASPAADDVHVGLEEAPRAIGAARGSPASAGRDRGGPRTHGASRRSRAGSSSSARVRSGERAAPRSPRPPSAVCACGARAASSARAA